MQKLQGSFHHEEFTRQEIIPRERREQYGVGVKILQSGCHFCFVYTAWNKRLEMVPSLPGSEERVQNIISEVRGKDNDSIYEDVGIHFSVRHCFRPECKRCSCLQCYLEREGGTAELRIRSHTNAIFHRRSYNIRIRAQ